MRFLYIALLVFSTNTYSVPSTCYGTTSNGRLVNGEQLPASGANFESYSRVAQLAGRTYVHSAVASIIVNSYKTLETEQPDKVFKYAEYLEKNIQFSKTKSWVRHDEHYHVDFLIPCEKDSAK